MLAQKPARDPPRSEARRLNIHPMGNPQGSKNSAQGNALGKRQKFPKALKGRNMISDLAVGGHCCALSGRFTIGDSIPGRSPGLEYASLSA
jgi:hypothetical protein